MIRVLIVLGWLWIAIVSSTASADQYHFDYHVSGAAEIQPLQVFDDGLKTYVQFPEQAALPAIFSVDASGMHLLYFHKERGLWVTDGCYHQLLFVLRHQTAMVVTTGRWPKEAAVYKPFVLNQSTTVRQEKKTGAPVVLAIDSGHRMPMSSVLMHQDIQQWPIRTSDGSLHVVLRQWVKMAGYQLLWHASDDFPIAADAVLSGHFLAVLNQLLHILLHQGVFLRFHIYEKNKVLLVEDASYRLSDHT